MKKMMLAAFAAVAVSGAVCAESLEAVFPADVKPDAAMVTALANDVKDAKLAYVFDFAHSKRIHQGDRVAEYKVDKSADIKDFKTVCYLVYLVKKDDTVQYVYTTMDAFTNDAKKIGVPTADVFQQKVSKLTVKSNVDGVKNGEFAEGNIEFWPYNYGQAAKLGLEGASSKDFDFDDTPQTAGDHGSMQVHNFMEKATVFGFSDWKNAPNCDLGIGTPAKGQPDWTFARNANNDYNTTLLFVFVK